MFGSMKRGLAVALLGLSIAACQVIPDAGQPEPVAPAPEPSSKPVTEALPTDTARHRVALLVPLSGPNAEVGQSLANATTMALLDTGADNLRITTYDTASGAGAAASRALDDGNALILGPLMRDNVSAVLGQARPAGVPLISFSNDLSVAAQDVFVMGHIPEQSVQRTVSYAIDNGARDFAALIPDGEYGDRVESALARAMTAGGASLVAIERYNRGNTSIVSAAERLNAEGGFDTVMIADGVRLSTLAAGALKDPGAALPQILGTELWSGESSLANVSAMRGALFSAVSDARYRQFLDSYQTRFGEEPYRIATLGYDAVLLTLRIAGDWQPGTPFPTDRMLGSDGFLGLDGPFRFRSDGVGERAMEVRQVVDGAVTVVDAAPNQF